VVTIHYFLHPLYSQQVQVVNELNFAAGKVYTIKLFDNIETHLPAWMTDPEYCRSCCLQERPQCSLAALRKLRALLNELAF